MKDKGVAPFAGAWIEISSNPKSSTVICVAPFAGAWIEIPHIQYCGHYQPTSLPSRERGLKFHLARQHVRLLCRSLRGSVD